MGFSSPSPSAASAADDTPYLLFSVFPLPCVPASLRRSSRFDLAVSTVCLFGAFLLHDGLQEEFYHALGIRAPIAITSLDFIGCAFWGWVVTRLTAPPRQLTARSNNASAKLEHTDSGNGSSNSSHGNGTGGSHNVQIELVRVAEAGSSQPSPVDIDPSPQRRVRQIVSQAARPSGTSAASPNVVAADQTPWTSYLAIGLLILLSNFLAIIALSYVEYPLKVILRSCKLIPTMIIGRVVMQKRYTVGHYIAAATLCTGVILFSLADMFQVSTAAAATSGAASAGARHLFADGEVLDADVAGAVNAVGLVLSTSGVAAAPPTADRTMAIGIALLVASVLVDALNPNIAEKFMKKNAAAAAAPSTVQPSVRSKAQQQQKLAGGEDDEDEDAPLLSHSTAPSAQSPGHASGGGGHSHGHGGARDPHSVNSFMFRTNVYVVPLLLCGVVVSGELPLLLSRIVMYPHVLPLFALYCTASYAGINAYTSLIARHGSVLTVGLATLRKICTIVLSYLFIGDSALVKSGATGGVSAEEELVDPALPSAAGRSHPLDPVSAPPAKHFGTQHLFPSALILLGLLLSAWVDRKKDGAHGPASSASPQPQRSAHQAPAAVYGADDIASSRRSDRSSRRHSDADDASDSDDRPTNSGGSGAAAAGSPDALRALAAELGLETGGETECETDVEQGHADGGHVTFIGGKSSILRGGSGAMAKHAPHLSAQLARDMWAADGDDDDDADGI